MTMNNDNRSLDANRDPLTGAPGAHPVGTGIGAFVGGAAAGAATGPGGRQQATPPRGAKAPLSNPGLALPHERDESTDTTAEAPDPMMVQASRDIAAGLVDTDMHATPGQDAELRERLVPGPGGKSPPSGG